MTDKRKSMHAARKARILEAHDGKCYRCGEAFDDGEKIEYDHKLALARGGTDDDENLGPCHVHCHALKTFGGNSKLGADIFEIAKTKRIKKKRAAPLGSKHFWASRPLSHPNLKKKLDGTVVRRDAS